MKTVISGISLFWLVLILAVTFESLNSQDLLNLKIFYRFFSRDMESVSRVYANVNENLPSSYWDYENAVIKFSSCDPYEVGKKIGKGKYSNVHEATNRKSGEEVVMKILKPVKQKKINRESRILQILQGGPNIVELKDICQDSDGTIALIFERVENEHYKILYPTLTDAEIRLICYRVLEALDFAHSKGIMHRDVKPLNIVYDRERSYVKLIDWGLAEFYHQYFKYNVRVASRHFKGPELLVGLRQYDYSLDMWSLGCVLGGMIFRKEKMFKGSDNYDQLRKITKLLGTDELYEYLGKYGITLEPEYEEVLEPYRKRSLHTLRNKNNKKLATDEAIDLVEKLLRYDHQERLTAREAMEHPYFASLHNRDN